MCIFCSIVKGEIPATRIYEDDTVLAILDISQVTKGHTLVIPKQHTENFMSCEPELMKHVMEVAQMLAKTHYGAYPCRGNECIKQYP